MAQITVMMAAYNTQTYIRRALDSILNQTFQDFDVIVVDDGSADQTGAILDGYADMDNRVHVLHQKNSGACVARNRALDWAEQHSDSQWCIFVDSDDWIHPKMLQYMLSAAQENQVRIVACGYEETTGADPVIREEDLQPTVCETMDFYQKHYLHANMACCKLFQKSLCKGVRNPEHNYYFDDEFLLYKILYGTDRIAILPAPLYAYFVNVTSLTKRPWNPRMLEAWVAYEQQIAFFQEQGRQDLVNFRLRGYLENAVVNDHAAQQAEDTPEVIAARKKIRRRIRQVLTRMYRAGCLHYRFDFDTLITYYPYATRVVRLWRETKERFGGGKRG